MLAATVTVIARQVFQFREEANLSMPLANEIDSLFCDLDSIDGEEAGPLTILLRHERREVVRATLGAIKVTGMTTVAVGNLGCEKFCKRLTQCIDGIDVCRWRALLWMRRDWSVY